MADPGALKELQQTNFFKGIEKNHLEALANLCKLVEFPPNATIFEEYEKAEDVYIIVDGTVSLAICEPDVRCRQIGTISDGDLIGWSPLVGRARLYDTARTTTAVRAYVFNGEELLEYCRTHSDFGFEFIHRALCVLADRLSGTRLQMLKMCGLDMPEFQIETD